MKKKEIPMEKYSIRNIEYTSSKTYTNSEVLFDIVQWNYIYIQTIWDNLQKALIAKLWGLIKCNTRSII